MPNIFSFKRLVFITLFLSLSCFSQAQKLQFLCLGDSYTIGQGVKIQERWANVITESFRSYQKYPLKYDEIDKPVVIAKTGWTSSDLIQGLKDYRPRGKYSLVTLMIGANNEYRRQSIDDFRRDIQFLIKKCLFYANGDKRYVLVLSIPDWSATPYGLAKGRRGEYEQIDAFNKVLMEEAQMSGVRFLDITTSSRQTKKDIFLICEDGLHPSAKLHKIWADQIIATITKQ